MTAPYRTPAGADLRVPEWESVPTWCTSCEIHRATTNHPLCPVCAPDDNTKEATR